MKLKYISFAAIALAVTASSCSKHDLFEENGTAGDRVPTVYYEVGSTACKAGESFSFKGKYYTEDGYTPDHTEIWYSVVRDESAAATVKLAGSLSYTKTVTENKLMRENQSIISFPHSAAEWTGKEFVINASVPTSSTLAPVSWNAPGEWDQEKFETYYPAEFAPEFCEKVIEYLTKDSTYYSSLRTVFVNYNFTNAQFAEMNAKYGLKFPTDIKEDTPEDASTDRASRWFSTTEASDSKIIGYYYITVNDQGQTIINEVGKDYVNPDVNLYPVYDAAPWVFCRYSDDTGSILATVRAEYMPAFKDLLGTISFSEWIYDSSNQNYAVAFQRDYSLESQFRAYDNEGHEGISADTRVISIN